MVEGYDGRIDSGVAKTEKQKGKTAIEMQKLLDLNDTAMNQEEQAEIRLIRKEVFDLKSETAKVTLRDIDRVRNLTAAQVVTLIEANYKGEDGRWLIPKQGDDGLIVAKQLALDILGRYRSGIDNVRGEGSQRAEFAYRREKGLSPRGDTARLLQCFVDDIRAGISPSLQKKPIQAEPTTSFVASLSVASSNGKSDVITSDDASLAGNTLVFTEGSVSPVDSTVLTPEKPLVFSSDASLIHTEQELHTNVDAAASFIKEIRYKPESLLTVPSNITLVRDFVPVDMIPVDDLLGTTIARLYKRHAGEIKSAADKLGIPPSVLANLLVKENAKMTHTAKRSWVGQMGAEEWKTGSKVYTSLTHESIGNFANNKNKTVEAIKAAAGFLRYHYNNCGDRFVAAQLYHAGSVLASTAEGNKTARYFARYNPAILRTCREYINPSIRSGTITASQYNLAAKLYYAIPADVRLQASPEEPIRS